jgi:hypothetical protein
VKHTTSSSIHKSVCLATFEKWNRLLEILVCAGSVTLSAAEVEAWHGADAGAWVWTV